MNRPTDEIHPTKPCPVCNTVEIDERQEMCDHCAHHLWYL